MGQRHMVKQGECLATIAERYGFDDAAAIHDHPDNRELKTTRPSAHLLLPGDEVAIPDRVPATLVLATGKRHVLVIKRPRRRLDLRLRDFDRTDFADQPYKLFFDGVLVKEEVATGGRIGHPVPLSVRRARLEVGDHRWDIDVGALNPIDETPDRGASGILGRMYGLGYHVDVDDPDLAAPRTRAAIRWFQRDHGIEPRGDLTDDTKAAIVRAFGC